MRSPMRAALLIGAVFILQGCQSAQLQHTAGTEGKAPSELAWIVTPLSTKVLAIDGAAISGNYKPLPSDNIQNWLAVLPGKHELTLFYDDSSVSAAASGKFMVDTTAGTTSYVYGRAGGGIRYYRKVLAGPANDVLIGHINTRIAEGKMPCAALPCTDQGTSQTE